VGTRRNISEQFQDSEHWGFRFLTEVSPLV
jgi:hypothetical protein